MKHLKRIDRLVSNGTKAFRRFGFLHWRMWCLSSGVSFFQPGQLLLVGGKYGSGGLLYVCRLISAVCSGVIYHWRRGEVQRLTATECFPESALLVKDIMDGFQASCPVPARACHQLLDDHHGGDLITSNITCLWNDRLVWKIMNH